MKAAPRSGPSDSSSLAREPFARIIATTITERRTGTLEFQRPDGAGAEVVVHRGELVKVRVPAPAIYLGAIAYELGYLRAEDLNATLLEVAKTRTLHGAILVARGLLKPPELERCLAVQSARKLHGLFAWPSETTYSFVPYRDALAGYGGNDWPTCDMRPSLWYGIREFARKDDVGRVVAMAAGSARFRLAHDAKLNAAGLEDEDLAAIERMRARAADMSELVHGGVPDRRRAELLFYFLFLAGALERHSVVSGVMPKTAATCPPAYNPDAGAELFEQAYAAMLAGKLDVAEVLTAEAHAMEPGEINHAALRIWLLALRPDCQGEAETRRAIGALSRILERCDESAHAHFFRGQLYKRIGLHDRAAADFHAAVNYDPKRTDAAAELRLYMARRRRA
jgi:tetratricopeptide (TPR) repeat protein